MLFERDATGDPSTSSGQRLKKATELLSEAAGIGRELGMVQLEKRLIGLQEKAAQWARPHRRTRSLLNRARGGGLAVSGERKNNS